jgi:hypothetical protein
MWRNLRRVEQRLALTDASREVLDLPMIEPELVERH